MVDVEAVRAAIGAVEDPEIHRSLAELGMVRQLQVSADGAVSTLIALTIPGCPLKDKLTRDVTEAARSVSGVTAVTVEFTHMTDEERTTLVADIRGGSATREITVGGPGSRTRVIAVSSGKGGVGKSSVTANLAVALARLGRTVGVIDADVWGFSIPRMLGSDRPPTVVGETLMPPEIHGVRVMSMDYFVRPDQAVMWRGPMLHKAMEQFLVDVHWDDPDYLLIDMPPGTGDIALSLAQFLPRSQSIVVTTPQQTAQRVAKRAGLMARKVNQEILGVVENMSWFTGDDGKRYDLFGDGGGQALADELEVPLLGQIPLVPAMRAGADAGLPVTIADPGGEAVQAFEALAAEVEARKPRVRAHPQLVVR
ncbi:MAG: Mrp/NBP35 family ATP-binding protein [Acidimicrobiia bacterium]|nr:Mrp/NBP35 family ATP-binding protein [Acidimicrobiia bacterium]